MVGRLRIGRSILRRSEFACNQPISLGSADSGWHSAPFVSAAVPIAVYLSPPRLWRFHYNGIAAM
jgi:hypothetical protein